MFNVSPHFSDRPRTKSRFGGYAFSLAIGFLLAGAPSQAQAIFKVPGTHAGIQEAVDACPAAGCVITLSDPLYKLPNTLLIYKKSNLTIKGAVGTRPVIQFQDKGLLAGPFFSAADQQYQVAGWKQWPINSSTAVGGSQNTSNPYSTSGYQQNGAVLIKESSSITFDNIVVDGVAPLPVGHLSIWMPGGNPTLLGNFGINMFLSKNVNLKNTKIINCFAGIYIFGRNKGGAMARNNQADLDKDQLLPNSQFGYTGQHTVEYSELANNIWGVYVESDWDIGSTFHHNLVYSNYNPDFANWMKCAAATGTCPTTAPTAVRGNSEAANHVGGFLYGKDFVTVAYKIYNNTFHQNAAIFGYGMWRATTQHLFYNNLIANPYLDYNASKTGVKTDNFKSYVVSGKELLSKYSDGLYSNTFSIFPQKITLNSMKATDSVAVGLSRSDSVFPSPRLQVNVQTQKLTWNFQATQYTPPGAATGTYVNLETPFKDSILYWSQANIQYQATEKGFPYNGWQLSSPAAPKTLPTKNHSVLGSLMGIVGASNTQLPAGVNPGDTIPIMDQPNQQQWVALDSAYVKTLRSTWTDTLGTIDTIATKDLRSHTNWYIKTVPFQSLDPASSKFLEPVWTDPGVDSVILDAGRWGVDPDGSIADVGAKSKSKGTSPSIVLQDGTQAKYDSIAGTIRFSFNLSEVGGNFVSYKYHIFTYASNVSDDDTPTLPYNPIDLPLGSIISGNPKVGDNNFEAKLATKPDARSRYQVMVIATTASGATVYSNMGVWLYKNDGFDMNVQFFDPTTKQQITTTRVGQQVIMRVRPVVSRDNMIKVVDGIKYFCRDVLSGSLSYLTATSLSAAKAACTGATKTVVSDTSWRDSLTGSRTANVYTGTLQVVQIRAVGLHDVANGGKLVDPTDIFRKNVVGEQDYLVVFTKAGPQVVGANGKDTVGVGGKKASFSGDGKITVRPGLPYIAQFQDPPSVSLADTGFIPKEARYPVKITVFDSVGNQVDTACEVKLETTSPTGGIGAVGTDPLAKTFTLRLDSANGTFLARTHDPVGFVFWLKSQVVVRDSARVKVTPPKESLKWSYAAGDSIFRYLGQTAKITLILLDGNEQPAISTASPSFTAYLKLEPGLKLVLPGNPDSALDSVVIDRTKTATIDLLVTSDVPVSDGAMTASNPDLNEPAIFTPVNFRAPPIPPYPSMDSAAWIDSDCDGALDQIRVYFKKDPVRRLKDSVQIADVVARLPGGTQVLVGTGAKILDADSSVVAISLTTPVPGTTPSGSVAVHLNLKRLSLPDTVLAAVVTGKTDTFVTASDRIGPRIVPQALIWENPTGTAKDTLRVVSSEPISYAGTAFPLLIQSGATWSRSTATVSSFWYGASHDTLFLEVAGNSGEIKEKAVVRFDPQGGIVDLSGNPGGDCPTAVDTLRAWVKPVPMIWSYLLDTDGNGAADSVVVGFSGKLSKSSHLPQSLVLAGWCTACADISIAPATLSTTDSIVFGAKISGLPVGATRGLGAKGQGSLIFKNPMLNQTIDVLDSVGPIPTSAAIKFGNGADTLVVNYSEPLKDLASGDWMIHQTGSALSLIKLSANAAGNQLTYLVASGAKPYPGVGDSIYLPNTGSRLVAANTATVPAMVPHPVRVPVLGGDRAPDSALVLDRNGDGTADAVRLFYSTAPIGNPTFVFNWAGKEVKVDSVAYKNAVGGQKDVTISVSGFQALTTSGAASATSTSYVDGAASGVIPFPLKDGIAPVLVSAYVSYGTAEGAPDTLILKMSEAASSVDPADGKQLLVNNQGTVAPVQGSKVAVVFAAGASEFRIVCSSDNCNLPGYGDFVRLATGSVTDLVKAVVGDSSRWVPVTTGPKPIRYNAEVYPKPVMELVAIGANPLRVVDPVSVWVRPENGTHWAAQGPTAAKWPAGKADNAAIDNGMIGVKLDLNTSFDGQFIAYDNMGTFVGNAAVKLDLATLQKQGLTNGANKFSLLVGLNGSDDKGGDLASGVYMIRVISYSEQIVNGQPLRVMVQNKVFTVGLHSKLK